METQDKETKSTWLARKFSSISLKWQILGLLLIAVGIFATVTFLIDNVEDWYDDIMSDDYYISENMGDKYEVHSYYDGERMCITEKGCHRAIVDNIEWVNGDKNDSLWVVAKDERRAYFNSQTGEFATQFIYRKAWRYSEGLAAVVNENYQLLFIDTQGAPAFKHTFKYNQQNYLDHRFRAGRCLVVDTTGKMGLIDRSGKWVEEPTYDSIAFIGDTNLGYWSLMRNDSLKVINTNGLTVINMTPGHKLNLTSDGNFEVWHQLRPGKLYDTTGNLLANQTYWNVKNIEYYEEYEELNTDVLVYYTDSDHCGMLSIDGQILTDAKYNEIESLGKNLFRAKYDIAPEVEENEEDEYDAYYYYYSDDSYQSTYVLLNNKGELVEGK